MDTNKLLQCSNKTLRFPSRSEYSMDREWKQEQEERDLPLGSLIIQYRTTADFIETFSCGGYVEGKVYKETKRLPPLQFSRKLRFPFPLILAPNATSFRGKNPLVRSDASILHKSINACTPLRVQSDFRSRLNFDNGLSSRIPVN